MRQYNPLSVFFLLVIAELTSLQPACGADDPVWIELLLNSYRQHVAACEAGKIQFSSHFEQRDSNEQIDIKGDVEWSDGYYFFDGERTALFSSNQGVIKERKGVRIVRSGNRIAARLDAFEPRPGTHMLFVRDTDARETGLDALSPNPVVMLASLEGNTTKFDTAFYEYPLSPIVKDSLLGPTSRDVSVNGSIVTVRSAYHGGRQDSLVFSTDHGLLCSDLHTERRQGGETINEKTHWVWSQAEDSRWFPSACTLTCSRGALLSEDYAVFECKIESFGPLVQPQFAGGLANNVFGDIPGGATVTQIGENGSPESFIQPTRESKQTDEGTLKKLAEQIRKQGFGKRPARTVE